METIKIPKTSRASRPNHTFWDVQQKYKNPFQGHHSKFEFLESCLNNADDPPGGGLRPPPPGGSLHSLATEKFELRIMALERFFLDFFEHLKTCGLVARPSEFFKIFPRARLSILIRWFLKRCLGCTRSESERDCFVHGLHRPFSNLQQINIF